MIILQTTPWSTPQCTLHNAHCKGHNPPCEQLTVHTRQCTIHSVTTPQYIIYSVHTPHHKVHCILHRSHFTVYIIHSAHYPVHTTQSTHSSVRTPKYAYFMVHTPQYAYSTVHTTQGRLHIVQDDDRTACVCTYGVPVIVFNFPCPSFITATGEIYSSTTQYRFNTVQCPQYSVVKYSEIYFNSISTVQVQYSVLQVQCRSLSC